jgi:hypothetical protein
MEVDAVNLWHMEWKLTPHDAHVIKFSLVLDRYRQFASLHNNSFELVVVVKNPRHGSEIGGKNDNIFYFFHSTEL